MKYDIIIQAGQSNAEGFGTGAVDCEYQKNPKVLVLEDAHTVAATEQGLVVNIASGLDNPFIIKEADNRMCNDTIRGDFSLTFAEEYVKSGRLAEDRALLIIRAAVGGSGFQRGHWGKYDYLYMRMLQMVEYALSLNEENRVVGFLWHQGEHDAFEGNTPEKYKAKVCYLVEQVRARYGNMPFICGDFVNEWKQKNIQACDPIIGALKDAVNELGNGGFVETADLLSNNQDHGDGDDIHFSRQSLRVLGQRYYKIFDQLTNA